MTANAGSLPRSADELAALYLEHPDAVPSSPVPPMSGSG
jgi:hypothetical protein